MRTVSFWAAALVGSALAFGNLTPAEAQPKPAAAKPAAAPKPGNKPAAKPGAKPVGKPAPKPAAKPTAKKIAPAAKKPGEPAQPDEAARRAIAGLAAQRKVRESPELAAMREVDLALFPSTAPDAGEPWRALGTPLSEAAAPQVTATGLPPAGQLAAITPAATTAAPRDLSYLKDLDMPDIPVRWDARVVRYLEFYKNSTKGKAMAVAWIKKSGRYAGMIRRVLKEQRLPEDVMWLSLIESAFDPLAHSHAGAAGLWQFMPEGARIYGLHVDRWIDERHDPERSTLAAARYLSDLKTRFGSWELAFAAYNMGYGGLLAAIKKYNTNDFWELSKLEAAVPLETALYVPKIVALAIVAKNKAAFGVDDVEPDSAVTADKVSVGSGVSLATVAAASGASVEELETLNPQVLAGRTPPLAPGLTVDVTWTLRVPAGGGQKTAKDLPALAAREPKLRRYVLKWGESIEDVAAAEHTTKSSLVALNGMRPGEVLRPGTVMFVPASAPKATAVPAAPAEKPIVVVPAYSFASQGKRRIFYKVVAGDSMREVADVLGVAATDLAKWNVMDASAALQEGMTLQAFVPEKQVLPGVVFLEEKEVRALAAGTPEFFAHFEGLKGRERVIVTAEDGDTLASVGRKYGLSVGMMERINQRSRTAKINAGDKLVVYRPISKNAPAKKASEVEEKEAKSAAPVAAPDPPAIEEPESKPAEETPALAPTPTTGAPVPLPKAPDSAAPAPSAPAAPPPRIDLVPQVPVPMPPPAPAPAPPKSP